MRTYPHKYTETVQAAIAAEVRAEIARLRVSGHEVSSQAAIPPSTFATKIRGGSAFTTAELTAIGKVIGVPASELLRRAETQLVASERQGVA